MGKTEALRAEYEQIIDTYGEHSAIFVDLEAVDSSQYIRDMIFNQQTYKHWLNFKIAVEGDLSLKTRCPLVF